MLRTHSSSLAMSVSSSQGFTSSSNDDFAISVGSEKWQLAVSMPLALSQELIWKKTNIDTLAPSQVQSELNIQLFEFKITWVIFFYYYYYYYGVELVSRIVEIHRYCMDYENYAI